MINQNVLKCKLFFVYYDLISIFATGDKGCFVS